MKSIIFSFQPASRKLDPTIVVSLMSFSSSSLLNWKKKISRLGGVLSPLNKLLTLFRISARSLSLSHTHTHSFSLALGFRGFVFVLCRDGHVKWLDQWVMHYHRLNILILKDSACIFATEGAALYHLNSYVRKVEAEEDTS